MTSGQGSVHQPGPVLDPETAGFPAPAVAAVPGSSDAAGAEADGDAAPLLDAVAEGLAVAVGSGVTSTV
jgi:hypothetical protein